MQTTGRDVWAARASACELAALSLRNPSEELARAVVSGEWAQACAELAALLGAPLPEGFGANTLPAGAVGADGDRGVDGLLSILRSEYARLFIGTPDAVTTPYEGIWRTSEQGGDALMFVNRYSREVAGFFAACGLGRASEANDPLDHVATEFELLEYLAAIEAGIAQIPADGPAADAFPGGSPASAFEMFAREHVSSWVPVLADKVRGETRLAFFCDAFEFAKSISSSFGD